MNLLDFEKLLNESIITKTTINVANLGLGPNEVCSYLIVLGYEQGEIETNGWEYDFWIYYTHPVKTIKLVHEGTWYYGISELKVV